MTKNGLNFGLVKMFVIIPFRQRFIRFSTKLYRQIVGIPMWIKCASLVADLFCFVMKES